MTDIGTAAVVGVLYFMLHTLGLLAVAYYMFVHISTSDAFLAYYWKRKSIFISLMVVFLDSATDLTVLITWYDLVEVEADLAELNDGEGFDSINMRTFFWPMVGCLIGYQLILMMMQCDSHHLWDLPIVVLQLYPFRAAYLSLHQDPVRQSQIATTQQTAREIEAAQLTLEPAEDIVGSDEEDQKAQEEPPVKPARHTGKLPSLVPFPFRLQAMSPRRAWRTR